MSENQDKKSDNKQFVLGVGVAGSSASSLLGKIDDFCHSSLKEPALVVTVNPEFVMLAQDDPEFKKILNSADLAIPDGAGLRFARLGLASVPGRRLVEELLRQSYRFFFLGGRDGVAKAMAEKYGGFYDPGHQDIKNIQPREDQRIIKKIKASHPDILLVAYGAPWQEKWLWGNRHRIKAKVMMGVGGTFDYLTGRAKLPPEWVNKIGLEWLWRLIHEPWRWRRQLQLIRFFVLVFWRRQQRGE